MSIGTGLAIASSGLTAIDQQLAIVSQNVANANTAGYALETATLTATTANGTGTGVISGPATASLNAAVTTQLNASLADQSYQGTISSALAGIDQMMGTPGQGNDLPSLLGNVQSAFSTLLTNPSSASQQNAVLGAAQTLTGQINAISGAIGSAGRAANSMIGAGVTTLNKTLSQVGTLNSQIIALTQQGKGTADLINQRNAAVQQIATLSGAKSMTQPDGTISLFTTNGVQLPTNGGTQLAANTTGVGTSFTLEGQAVSLGGSLGGNQQLINTTLPQIQAGLDSFSQALAGRFASSGLSLFTDAAGSVPATASNGLSSAITVNPSVIATPSSITNGNLTITDSTGATIAPNPPTGPAGYTTLIQNVLAYAFGVNAASGGAQPSATNTYVNAGGTATLPYSGSGSLGSIANNFAANEADVSSNAQTASTSAASLATALTGQASATSGVSIDQQMGLLVTLQNSYAANAKVVSIAQQMWQAQEAMIS